MDCNIYKIINTVNDKEYIGMTFEELDLRLYRHYSTYKNKKNKCKFHKAIGEIGFKNFSIHLIRKVKVKNLREAHLLESTYILKHNSISEGYNSMLSYEIKYNCLLCGYMNKNKRNFETHCKGLEHDQNKDIFLWKTKYKL